MSSSPPAPSEALTPIVQVIQSVPVLLSYSYKSLLFVIQNAAWLLGKISYPVVLLSPHPVFLYVFAPLIILVQIILGISVFSPIRAVGFLLDLVYPLYVFCGVACIVGTLLGITARLLASHLSGMAADSEYQNLPEEKDVVKFEHE